MKEEIYKRLEHLNHEVGFYKGILIGFFLILLGYFSGNLLFYAGCLK